VFQFNLDDEVFVVAIADNAVQVSEGAVEKPSIQLTMTSADFLDLVSGKLNGQTAFLTGKLKVKGDMTLALKLQSVFNIGG